MTSDFKKHLKKLLICFNRTRYSSLLKRVVFKLYVKSNSLFSLRQPTTNFLRVSDEIRSNPICRSGPFAGLKYPCSISYGSSFYPKILGTYESELHGLISTFPSIGFQTIIDIGCAEGYYAVGLSLLLKPTTVYALDIDKEALRLCAQLAAANQIKLNIRQVESFDLPTLSSAELTVPSLFLLDCEGAENYYLTHDFIASHPSSHFLIECHDFLIPGTTAQLVQKFKATHTSQLILSIDDAFKPLILGADYFPDLSYEDAKVILAEDRPSQMSWLYCSPKTHVRAAYATTNA